MPAFITYVTCPDVKEAKSIAKALLELKYCACANILSPHTALFVWEEKVQEEQEVILLVKSSQNTLKQCQELIKEKHSYDIPCVMSWPIEDGNPDFLQWIEQSCKL